MLQFKNNTCIKAKACFCEHRVFSPSVLRWSEGSSTFRCLVTWPRDLFFLSISGRNLFSGLSSLDHRVLCIRADSLSNASQVKRMTRYSSRQKRERFLRRRNSTKIHSAASFLPATRRTSIHFCSLCMEAKEPARAAAHAGLVEPRLRRVQVAKGSSELW